MKIKEDTLDKIFDLLTDDDGDSLGAVIGRITESLSGIAVSLNKLVEVADKWSRQAQGDNNERQPK